MIFTSPPSPKAMIDDAFFVGLPSKRGLTTKSTPSMISRDTSASPAGVASPEMLAEVETTGRPSPRSIRRQNSWSGIRTPSVRSSGIRFSATPAAPGRIAVSGLVASSMTSNAMPGALFT